MAHVREFRDGMSPQEGPQRKREKKKKPGGGGRVEWGVKRRFTSNVKNLVAVAPEEPFDL